MASQILLGSLIVATVLVTCYGQATFSRPIGGINPSDARDVCFRPSRIDNNVRRVTFVADQENSCWYWQCTRRRRRITLMQRNCPLGTAVSDFFFHGSANPCTENVANRNLEKFFCRRKKFLTGPPPCVAEFERQGTCNSGRVVYTYSTCSCDCSGTGFADWDCSKRQEDLVGAPVVVDPNDPCPNGIPRTNWCEAASVNGRSPCLNNGQCRNECLNYTCICTPPFTAGRNCESFQCSENVECLNGGTCDRGPSGMDQTPTCRCLPGTSGLMCEIGTIA